MKYKGKFNNSKSRNCDDQTEKRYGAKSKSEHQRTRRNKRSEEDFYDEQDYDSYENSSKNDEDNN